MTRSEKLALVAMELYQEYLLQQRLCSCGGSVESVARERANAALLMADLVRKKFEDELEGDEE